MKILTQTLLLTCCALFLARAVRADTIKKDLISAYYLSVEGVSDSVAVRRVKP